MLILISPVLSTHMFCADVIPKLIFTIVVIEKIRQTKIVIKDISFFLFTFMLVPLSVIYNMYCDETV